MIVEVVVLLGVQHLEQGRGWIAAHVAAHLVDFIEQEQRVAHANLGHLLNQSSRHRTDVGPPVPTNFRFVTHTTQGHAHELAVGGIGDRFRQGGLADPGRAHQAQYRAANLLHALLHGEVFEDPFLDLFQAVVVGIEDVLGARQVQAYLALGLPRHLHQPVDVGANHGGLGGHRRHLLELVQLGLGLGHGVLRQPGGIDALLQFFDFVVTFVTIAQLFLNGLHLLIQVVLALAALHLLLDATTDAFFHLQQIDLGIQQGQDMLDPCGQVDDLEDFLLLLDLQRHVRRHGIHQATGLIDTIEGRKNLGRDLLAQLYILLELGQQAANENFRLAVGSFDLINQGDFGTAVAVHFAEALDSAALLALDKHLDSAIGQLEQLQHSRNGTYAIECILTGIVISRVSLCQQQNLLVARHRCLKGFDRLLAPHEQRDNHVRINYDITQWQERQFDGCLHDFASTAAIRP